MAQDVPRLIIDPSVDQSKIDILGLWAREIYPRMLRLVGSRLPETITFRFDATATFAHMECPSADIRDYVCHNPVVVINSYAYQTSRQPLNDGAYLDLTHEVGHALTPLSIIPFGFGEGFVEAMKCFVYQEAHKANPQISPCFDGQFQDALNNVDAKAGAGARDSTIQPLYSYDSLTGPQQLLLQSEGDFRAVTRTFEQPDPQLSSLDPLRLTASALGNRKIGGVSIVTFLDRAIATRERGPNGTFFGIVPIGQPAPLDMQGSLSKTIVNPNRVDVAYFRRENETATRLNFTRLPAEIEWSVVNAYGQTVVTKTVNHIGDGSSASPGQTTWFVLPDLCYRQDSGYYLCSLPDGGYKVSACVQGTSLCDTAFFGIYRRDPRWQYDSIFVITNGPGFEDLNAGEQLTYSDPDVEVLPGLVRFRNTSTADRFITAWGKKLGFAHHNMFSPVYYLTRRSQPALDAVVDSAVYEKGPVTPGSWITLFGWGFSHVDPDYPTTVPFPFEGCDKATSVVFTDSAGNEMTGATNYCGNRQINIQVPQELREGTYKVKVVMNGVSSAAFDQTIVTVAPKIFLVRYPDIGAIITQEGRVITEESPAVPGETLSLFGMGLGPVHPDAPGTGKPAAAPPLRYSQIQTQALLDGVDCEVSYAGLAPWLIGAYQVNFKVPSDTSSGIHTFKLQVGDKTSNQVKLAIR